MARIEDPSKVTPVAPPQSVSYKPPEEPLEPPLSPTTTYQEDLTTAGQRRVNLIWEYTQAAVALTVTLAVIYSAITGIVSDTLTNAFFLIIGFYYSRTNHAAIGGIGKKPSSEYVGR